MFERQTIVNGRPHTEKHMRNRLRWQVRFALMKLLLNNMYRYIAFYKKKAQNTEVFVTP